MYFNLKSIGILSVYPKFKKLLDLALAGGINGMITISSSSCENGIEISKYVYFLFWDLKDNFIIFFIFSPISESLMQHN